MTLSSDRRIPQLALEAVVPIDADLRLQIADAIAHRHGGRLPADETIRIAARTSGDAAVAIAVVGSDVRAHEVFVFARGAGAALDGPLGVAVDVLDGILKRIVGADDAFVPLDWEGRPWGAGVVFVRGEVRHYVAEAAAAQLLGEPMEPRAIP